jgi:hypothetical protein
VTTAASSAVASVATAMLKVAFLSFKVPICELSTYVFEQLTVWLILASRRAFEMLSYCLAVKRILSKDLDVHFFLLYLDDHVELTQN